MTGMWLLPVRISLYLNNIKMMEYSHPSEFATLLDGKSFGYKARAALQLHCRGNFI